MISFSAFQNSLSDNQPPADLSPELQALWHDGKGDWERAHHLVQDGTSPTASLLHAYLHRKEGDQWNANYWYTRAGRKMPKTTLDEEWEALVRELLGA